MGLVTRDERGRHVVPVCMMGQAAMWVVAVGLLTWDTFGGPLEAGKWGLLCAVGAGAWSVIYALRQRAAMLQAAFNLGRDTELRRVQ